jgi:hypothetical protein
VASSFDDDPRWLLVQRIVASTGFVNSHRLSTFLLYVSRQSLAGEGASLNERSIGEAVFERSPDYDPRDDNIVRSHASRLRGRLEEYFAAEGALEPLRVTIPRGSYAPVFDAAEAVPHGPDGHPAATQTELPVQDRAMPAPSTWGRLRLSKSSILSLALLVAVIVAASPFAYLRFHPASSKTASHKLWSQMFRSDRETIIVPADSSLVIARLMVGHQIKLSDYAGGQYRQDPECSKPCDLRMVNTVEGLRYTSMSDLEFAVKVTHLPEAILNRTDIRYARDLELKDFKESNLILAGSQEADPWLSAISGQMNFLVHDDPSAGSLRVENRQPKVGEQSEYSYDSHDPQHRGLATIAFLPNLGGTGNVLVVQGFSLAGTQAAAEFVTSEKDLDALFPAYSGNSAQLPHFEILLATVEINGMATHAVPLAWHVYP